MNWALYVIAVIQAARTLHGLFGMARAEKRGGADAVGLVLASLTEAAMTVVLVLAAVRLS